jgi:hydroxyethylthiazole kinase-like uncharacterized protein yjeF
LLKERRWEVEVFLYGDEAKLPPDAAENCRRWREKGAVLSATKCRQRLEKALLALTRDDLSVDAIFGTGLSRGFDEDLRSVYQTWFTARLSSFFSNVCVDIRSGICSDSGREIGSSAAFDGELHVTFHRPKLAHFLGLASPYCEKLVVADIGLEKWSKTSSGHAESDQIVHSTLRWPSFTRDELRKTAFDHKYTHGHALILSGGVGKGGAARLAARGALRIGAGLVTVGPPPAAIIENAAQLNAVMLRPVADADALAEILKDDRLNALCLGPGLGVGAHTLGLAAAALAAKRGTVLDADALTSFVEDPSKLFALLHDKCVLTPHLGEFARLFPDIAEKLAEPATKGPAYSKVDATREAAARAGCVILLKGSDTVIADPQGRAAINSAHYDRAAPWLATAGSGDVLAGMITGLLARGFGPMPAAETAAWLHVEAARKFGPGLIAEDLPEMLPAVFRDLGL